MQLPVRKNGHSIVELVVVLSTIFGLLAIMLPAISRSREYMRRQTCANKMLSASQGVLAYEMLQTHLPVAGLVAPDNDRTFQRGGYDPYSGSQHSWVTFILPFLDRQDLFDDFDLTVAISSQPGNPQSRQLAELECPVDQSHDRKCQAMNRLYSVTNFVAFVSPAHVEHQRWYPGALGGFIPGEKEGQQLKKISDGLTRTYLLTEIRTRRRNKEVLNGTSQNDIRISDPRGVWATSWAGGSVIAADVHPEKYSEYDLDAFPYSPDPESAKRDGMTPNRMDIGDQIFPCPRMVSSFSDGMPCLRRGSYGRGFSAVAPRSLHEGGVNTVFLDSHHEFTSDLIDPILYAQRISVDDGSVEFDTRAGVE